MQEWIVAVFEGARVVSLFYFGGCPAVFIGVI